MSGTWSTMRVNSSQLMSAGGSSVLEGARAGLAQQVAAVGDLEIEADRRRPPRRRAPLADRLEIAARIDGLGRCHSAAPYIEPRTPRGDLLPAARPRCRIEEFANAQPLDAARGRRGGVGGKGVGRRCRGQFATEPPQRRRVVDIVPGVELDHRKTERASPLSRLCGDIPGAPGDILEQVNMGRSSCRADSNRHPPPHPARSGRRPRQVPQPIGRAANSARSGYRN